MGLSKSNRRVTKGDTLEGLSGQGKLLEERDLDRQKRKK